MRTIYIVNNYYGKDFENMQRAKIRETRRALILAAASPLSVRKK